MNSATNCVKCGNQIEPDAQFCSKCGTKVEAVSIKAQNSKKETSGPLDSPKSGKVTLILCLLFGMFGVHRFYVGKLWTGILMLLSIGGLGAWVLIDLILIIKNKFDDKQGRALEVVHHLPPLQEMGLIAATVAIWFAVCIWSAVQISTYSTYLYTKTALVTVIDSQLAELNAGNIEKAYSYNSTELQNSLSVENFKKSVSLLPALINNESTQFEVQKIVNNMGFLVGTLKAKDGTKSTVEYQLIYQDRQWKIRNIKIIATVPGTSGKSPK